MSKGLLSADRLRTTPALLRAWSIGVSVLLAAAAIAGALAARSLVTSTDEIAENTGPVLIETQGLVASIAEADAANTAVFLSGANEDRQQRRLYESALERAPRQMEEISARLGDDATSRVALQAAGSQLTEYAGVVESARTKNVARIAGATADLERALELAGGDTGMLANVSTVNERSQARLDDDISVPPVLVIVTLALLAAALLALLIAQLRLRSITKRLLNPGLLIATVLTVGALVWLTAALLTRTADLDQARQDGYDAIALTGELQTEAFSFKTREAQAILGTAEFSGEERQLASVRIDTLLNQVIATSDSLREIEAAEALGTRWNRYLATSNAIAQSLASGQDDTARALAITDGNRDFNGFNTTVESILLRNRDQFDANVASAQNRLNWIQLGMLALPLLAILFVLAGYQPRINEYW